MKSKIKTIFKNKIAKWGWRSFLFFWTLSLLVLIIKWQQLPPEVPLYYSLPWGEEQLTNPLNLIILPLVSLIAFLFNFYLACVFFGKDSWLSRLLILTGLAVSFLSMFTLIKIIFLIT